MLLVIPSIELHEGRCIFCISGEAGTEKYYEDITNHPDNLIKLLRKENAKSILIYDMDSFSDPAHKNLKLISYLVKSTDIPVVLHSNFQTIDECRELFSLGVFCIILDSIALTDTEGVKSLISEYTSSRVIFNLPVIDDLVVFTHINKTVDLNEYLIYIYELGAHRVLYYELNNSAAKPVQYENNFELIKNFGLKISIANDIDDVSQLWKLNDYTGYGVDSIVIGRAFYENRFPCQKIWRLIEAKLEV